MRRLAVECRSPAVTTTKDRLVRVNAPTDITSDQPGICHSSRLGTVVTEKTPAPHHAPHGPTTNCFPAAGDEINARPPRATRTLLPAIASVPAATRSRNENGILKKQADLSGHRTNERGC